MQKIMNNCTSDEEIFLIRNSLDLELQEST